MPWGIGSGAYVPYAIMAKAYIVTDLGFGDSGKGTITDFLVHHHNAEWVVRYNGGPQCGHRVVLSDGREHVFAQFSSGTLRGAKTFYSKYALFNPNALVFEERKLRKLGIADAFDRFYVDTGALVTTPYHVCANRIREYLRGKERHGSCGMGIGETMADYLKDETNANIAVRAMDLLEKDRLAVKLTWIRFSKQDELMEDIVRLKVQKDLPPSIAEAIRILESDSEFDATLEVYEYVAKQVNIMVDYVDAVLRGDKPIVFEGAQGVLLDETHGFHPYTTWSTTTPKNALGLLESTGREPVVIGVLRTYAVRHGTGPFPTEDKRLTKQKDLQDPNNPYNEWQGRLRIGYFDAVLARYAVEVCGKVDRLAITHAENRIGGILHGRPICTRYQVKQPSPFFDGTQEIKRLKVRKRPSLEHQAELAAFLGKCKPSSFAYSWNRDDFLASIQRQVGVPIGIVSTGPTAEDKTFCGLGK